MPTVQKWLPCQQSKGNILGLKHITTDCIYYEAVNAIELLICRRFQDIIICTVDVELHGSDDADITKKNGFSSSAISATFDVYDFWNAPRKTTIVPSAILFAFSVFGSFINSTHLLNWIIILRIKMIILTFYLYAHNVYYRKSHLMG